MSKYQPLADHLGHLTGHEWRPTFHELERLLGSDLPKAARSKPDWWSDSGKGHAALWNSVGWSAEADVEGEKVIFRKKDEDMSMNTEQDTDTQRSRVTERGRELLETGREVLNTGREQVLSAAERAAPAVKKYGPWAALGVAVAGVVGFITFRSLRNRD